MQKIVFENLNTVFLFLYPDQMMSALKVLTYFVVASFLFTPLIGESVIAQVTDGQSFSDENFVEYHKLKIRSVENISSSKRASKPSDLIFFPLTPVEDDMAKNLDSHWIWSENTLDIIDSYSPFLFRTKKSAKVDEVKVLLQVNSMGRLSGVEIVSDVDKGLQERIDYVLRRLPDCKPVPGFEKYGMETFELTIKK